MAEAFLKVIIDNLSSLIREEIGLMMGVDKEMKKLSSTLTTIQAVLEDAELKQIKSKPIRDWLCKLNCLAYEIDDILDECATRVTKLKHAHSKLSRYSLNQVLYRHKIGRRIKQVTTKLDSVAAERAKFHLREIPLDSPRDVAATRETGSLLNDSDQILGRDEDREKIVKMLVEDVRDNQEMSVQLIIGVGGLGKTALTRLVFNDPRVVEHFEKRLWVCVSDNFEIKSLVKAMIESATGSRKASDLQHLDALQRTLSELLRQKRYLLVLDDVWNEHQEKWFELRDILSNGSTGASIIVTTRQKKVADIMGTLPSHCLKGLSDEHCWMLLRQRAFGQDDEVYWNLEVIGKQIVKKCAGVPLAAKALGGILRFKRREEEWIEVNESDIWKLSHEDTLILPTLRLSYHHLPLELRPCFAYFAAFDKDYVIDKKELILLWMAQGYISPKGTLELEDVGDGICNELVNRSLLQTTDSGSTISMHDLVHDLAQAVMENKVPGVLLDGNITGSASTIRQVCLRDNYVAFPKRSQQNMDISSIMKLTSLRVVDASKYEIEFLPRAIANLKHLRYLNMSSSTIRMLPDSLCSLWNLKILSMNFCEQLLKLPKGMRYLHNLRHLFLEGCESLREMPSGLGELVGLKTLSVFVVGRDRGSQLEELQCLNLSGTLEILHLERLKNYIEARDANLAGKKNLRKLILRWEWEWEWELEWDILSESKVNADEKVLEALQPHANLESLTVSGFRGRYFPVWMRNPILGKIVEIDIINCRNCVRLPKLGELPHLKVLWVMNVAMVEYIIEDEEVENGNPDKIQFPALERLHLSHLPNLKGFSREQEMSKEAFPNLISLWVDDCSSLLLTPLSSSSSMKRLEKVECSSSTVASFSELETLTRLTVKMDEELTCFPIETLAKLCNLQSLTIHGAQEISVTVEGLQAFKKLTSLEIEFCDTLRCLPEGLLQHLTTLEDLNITMCPEIVKLPEKIKHLQKLKFIYLSDLPKMACLPKALQHLSSLRVLSLHSLPELDSLPQLPSLAFLVLDGCAKVVSLPPLPNLKGLMLSNCPELERRCERGTGEDWHKIAHIPRLRIGPR